VKTLLCLAILTLAGPPSRLVAQDLITFRFHGVVNQVQIDEGPAPPGVGVGSCFDGTYIFDPAATDSANYDYHGVYHTLTPGAVQASIEDLHWHADESFVAIINGEPQQRDVYEAGASRITLGGPPELAQRLDIWIFQLTLSGDGDNLSDASLLQSPPEISAWSEARLLMIGESTIYSGLDPMPAVMISASLTSLELAGNLAQDDLAAWQANFGSTVSATRGQGDMDGDGGVDGGDFLAWQQRIGGSAPAMVTTAVPEPGVVIIVLMACGAGSIYQRRPRPSFLRQA
jgi:hypothetical protein